MENAILMAYPTPLQKCRARQLEHQVALFTQEHNQIDGAAPG